MNKNAKMNHNPSKGKRNSNRLTIVLACIAGILAILLGAMLYLLPEKEPEAPPVETTVPVTEEPTVSTEEEETEAPTEEPTEPPVTEPVMLPRMAELYEKYPDVTGWIRIDDTTLDDPVTFVPGDPAKYDRVNLDGRYTVGGVPYIDSNVCSMDPESTNLVIYGHNMHSNNTIFHCLLEYAKKDYWEEHPEIYFSTLYEERTYEVAYAFYDRIKYKYEEGFRFYYFDGGETEEEFNEAIAYYEEMAEYDTGINPEYGDRLITLLTCSYHHKYGRFVVIGRLVTDDAETPETVLNDTAG